LNQDNYYYYNNYIKSNSSEMRKRSEIIFDDDDDDDDGAMTWPAVIGGKGAFDAYLSSFLSIIMAEPSSSAKRLKPSEERFEQWLALPQEKQMQVLAKLFVEDPDLAQQWIRAQADELRAQVDRESKLREQAEREREQAEREREQAERERELAEREREQAEREREAFALQLAQKNEEIRKLKFRQLFLTGTPVARFQALDQVLQKSNSDFFLSIPSKGPLLKWNN
jgi:hypothetical protein